MMAVPEVPVSIDKLSVAIRPCNEIITTLNSKGTSSGYVPLSHAT